MVKTDEAEPPEETDTLTGLNDPETPVGALDIANVTCPENPLMLPIVSVAVPDWPA